MMTNRRILAILGSVRRRQLAMLALRGSVLGLLASSLAGIALGVWRWSSPGGLTASWPLVVLLAGPLLGVLAGLFGGRGLASAASAVDSRCGLKDRVITSLDFLGRPKFTPIHELQLADTEGHLEGVDPRRVVPFRAPRALPWAVAACLVALSVLFWPRPSLEAKPVAPLEAVVAAAEDASAGLEELEKVADKENDPRLKDLVKQIRDKIEEMKQPGVEVREALAKLSEMQAAIAAQQALFNVGMVDTQMKSLGEAMAATQALESAGNALQQEKYAKAAQELEQAEPQFDRKEAKTLKEQLKKAAQAMGASGLGELSESTAQLAESLDDARSSQSELRKLGKLARAHGRRKEIANLLRLQTQLLSECKGNCQKNGGAQVRLRKKSDKPSSSWGRGISGNVDGEKTTLDAARRLDTLKGQNDEGPSEVETTHSPEGRQSAARQYRDQYQKYRRMSEAALNSEPIPLGYRQTIRRYFELIRPEGDEVEKSDVKSSPRPGQ